MSYRKIFIEPAKSGKSSCKKCGKVIEEGNLRLKVVDARDFNAAIRKYGGGHEGASRGYVETQNGVISIQKYFVHLDCYVPIKKHPFTKDYFDVKTVTKPHHKAAFEAWLAGRARKGDAVEPIAKTDKKTKPKKKKDDDDDGDEDEDYKQTKVARKKKISKKE